MRVLDVFSNLPVKELSIEQIEDIFLKSCSGVVNDTYTVVHELPESAESNTVELKNELLREGKQVAYLQQDGVMVEVLQQKWKVEQVYWSLKLSWIRLVAVM